MQGSVYSFLLLCKKVELKDCNIKSCKLQEKEAQVTDLHHKGGAGDQRYGAPTPNWPSTCMPDATKVAQPLVINKNLPNN